MLRKVLIGALMITALLAAPATAQYGDFAITPGSVSVAGVATFQGRGCSPGSTVTITTGGTVLTTVTADSAGDFRGAFNANLSVGSHTITATCGDVVRSSPLNVLSTSGAPRPTGPLPRTGSNSTTMALVGAGMLALGGAVLATRKRAIV